MGAVGGLLGLGGGNAGTGFGTNYGTNSGQLENSYNQAQGTIQGQTNLLNALQGQGGLQNQSQVYNQLQGIANGTGPNPAQAMLNQATGQNVANQAALAAGQRGASANVGLMGRQAAQTGANLQQQAVGQGASMQAQQGLNAINSAGSLANTMAGQQIGQTNQNAATVQNEQNVLQGANTAANSVQGQLANTSMGNQQSAIGGLGNSAGLGAALLGAKGGVVPLMAAGGLTDIAPYAGAQSMFGQTLQSLNEPMVPSFTQAQKRPAPAAKAPQKPIPMGTNNQSTDNNITGANPTDLTSGSAINSNDASAGQPLGSIGMAAAKGGTVKALVSPEEIILTPEEAKMVADGRARATQIGEKVPGKAPIKGNSYKNDIVPKNLPEGGVVVPNEKTQTKNPDESAQKFVKACISKKKVKA